MQAWNDYHPPELPEVTIGKVDRRRRRAIANACKLNSELNWWCRLFAALGTVPKYIGEAEGLESWKADFNWVLNHAQEAHELIECEGGYVEMEEQGCLNEEKTREREGERQH